MSKLKGKSDKDWSIVIYILPAVLVITGMFFAVRISAEQSGSSPESGITSKIMTTYDSLVSSNLGSEDSGSWGDWGSVWNRIRSAGEWTPSGNATEEDVLSGKTFYSADSRTEKTGNYSPVTMDYSLQKNISYDDGICDQNNGELDSDCAAGRAEYVGEESVWNLTASGGVAASVTDNSITQALTSNKVYQDTRTGVYWTDISSGTMDLEAAYINGQDRVNPSGNSCNFNSAGTANAYCDNVSSGYWTGDNDVSAAEFCLNLELDADNADGDNNGLTGVETDWRLPSIKEIFQANINGGTNYLPNVNTKTWSSTFWIWNGGAEFGYHSPINIGYNNWNGASMRNSNFNVRCIRGN
jgi:hypothetical protein